MMGTVSERTLPANLPVAGCFGLIRTVILSMATALACPVVASTIERKADGSNQFGESGALGVSPALSRPTRIMQVPRHGTPLVEGDLADGSVMACDDNDDEREACAGLAPACQPITCQVLLAAQPRTSGCTGEPAAAQAPALEWLRAYRC